jgi:hypothetical protein
MPHLRLEFTSTNNMKANQDRVSTVTRLAALPTQLWSVPQRALDFGAQWFQLFLPTPDSGGNSTANSEELHVFSSNSSLLAELRFAFTKLCTVMPDLPSNF